MKKVKMLINPNNDNYNEEVVFDINNFVKLSTRMSSTYGFDKEKTRITALDNSDCYKIDQFIPSKLEKDALIVMLLAKSDSNDFSFVIDYYTEELFKNSKDQLLDFFFLKPTKTELSLKREEKLSKFLCFVLRHKPSAAKVSLDTEGWCSVDDLLFNLKETSNKMTINELKLIVERDGKDRYSFKDNFKYIRAKQGHSIEYIDIKYKKFEPKQPLYHGTSPEFVDAILKEGLKPQSRNYVHLSIDIETAKIVGKRHSKLKDPVILEISHDSDIDFWITDNNVVHAKYIFPENLKVL